MGRRAKGDGALFKRKDGRWQGEILLGYDGNGKPDKKTITRKTQKEAKEELDRLKKQVSEGSFIKEKTTLKGYLDHWLKTKEDVVKPRTVELYKEQAERYVYPRLGGELLNKISTPRIRAVLMEVKEQIGACTANKVRTLLLSVLKQAMHDGLIPRNPVESVKKFREEQKEMVLWTSDEVVRFLNATQSHRLYAAFYLLITTGLRRGELLGLHWGDLKGNVLHIQRSLTLLGGKPAISTPKTAKGKRRVVLSDDVMDVLEKHRQRQDEERAALGEAWPGTDFIFTSVEGMAVTPFAISNIWAKVLKTTGMPKARLHDMRHLHVSHLVRQGLDPRTIANRVGHTDPSFTLNRYSHVLEDYEQATALGLSQLLDPLSARHIN